MDIFYEVCHPTCETCTDNIELDCIKCKEKFYYTKKKLCEEKCLTTEYGDITNRICKDCSKECLECVESADNCTKCAKGSYPQKGPEKSTCLSCHYSCIECEKED